jgi:hypothetical protein
VLFWALVVPPVMFVPGCIAVIWGPRSPSELVFALFVVPMIMEIGAVAIAILLLVVGGYRTRNNVIVTWVGAVPVVVLIGMWLFWNLTHFHI